MARKKAGQAKQCAGAEVPETHTQGFLVGPPKDCAFKPSGAAAAAAAAGAAGAAGAGLGGWRVAAADEGGNHGRGGEGGGDMATTSSSLSEDDRTTTTGLNITASNDQKLPSCCLCNCARVLSNESSAAPCIHSSGSTNCKRLHARRLRLLDDPRAACGGGA
jgi:hypothetical protein